MPGLRCRPRAPAREFLGGVKLLFDENLSPGPVHALELEYLGSTYVRSLGLQGTTDAVIWNGPS